MPTTCSKGTSSWWCLEDPIGFCETSQDPHGQSKKKFSSHHLGIPFLFLLYRPGASAQKSDILSGTHERTGFFQVRANMSSHFKIAKRSSSFSALFRKKKSGPVPGIILLLFFTLKHHFSALFCPKKSGPKERADQKSGSFFISLKNRAHFSEQEAEMSVKNERERTPKKRANGRSAFVCMCVFFMTQHTHTHTQKPEKPEKVTRRCL